MINCPRKRIIKISQKLDIVIEFIDADDKKHRVLKIKEEQYVFNYLEKQ